MPKVTFTDISIRSIKLPDKGQVDYWDRSLARFGLRVSSSSSKTFVLLYYQGSRKRRYTIGRYPEISLSRARTEAKRLLAEITLGNYPNAEETAVLSFSQALCEFVAIYLRQNNRPTTARETERILRRDFAPLLSRPLNTIASEDIAKILDGLIDRPSMANHAFAAIRKMMNWCYERQYLDSVPTGRMKPPAKTTSRDRILSDTEIKAIYEAAVSIGYPFGHIVQLLTLTAQRRNEVASMHWNHIDLDERTWTIPSELTKANRPQTIPLTDTLVEIIDNIPRLNETLLFPARGTRDRTYSGFSKGKIRLDKISGVSDWTLHDLRRTAATGMAQQNTPPHVIERVLNHTTGTLGGVAGIYNRFGYIDEMRDALITWSEHISSIVID